MTEQELVLIIEEYQVKLKLLIKSDVEKGVPKVDTKKSVVKLANELEASITNYDKRFAKEARISLIECFVRWYNKTIKELIQTAFNTGNLLIFSMLYKIDPQLEMNSNYQEVIKRVPPEKKDILKGKGTVVIDDKGARFDNNQTNFREYVTSGESGQQQNLIKNYSDKVVNAMRDFKTSGITNIEVDKNGVSRRVNLRNKAEMLVRYNAKIEDMNRLTDKGYKFVVASSHADASERCSYWQGKIFLLDTASMEATGQYNKKSHRPNPTPIGKIDGNNYYSIKEALSYGFLGYNCRHRLIPYTSGMNLPPQYKSVSRGHQEAIGIQQRRMERNVRNCKINEALASSTNERKYWIARSLEEQGLYRSFCSRHKLVREDWRCSITREERDFEGIK